MRRDYATYTRCGETAGSLREVGEESGTAERDINCSNMATTVITTRLAHLHSVKVAFYPLVGRCAVPRRLICAAENWRQLAFRIPAVPACAFPCPYMPFE